MKHFKSLGLTILGLGIVSTGTWMYANNSYLETCILLVLGVSVLLIDRKKAGAGEEKIKKLCNWMGLLIAAITLALLIRKDIAYGGFFKKPTQPTIYTLLTNEIA